MSASRHHPSDLVGHVPRRRPFEACSADSKHAARRRVQLKSDLWELDVIMLNPSVKWELTAWPFMDMANVAVSHLVAGPW